jgi:hypothetical protein
MGGSKTGSFKLTEAESWVGEPAKGVDRKRPKGLVSASHEGGCWYLRGNIGGSPIEMLVDTGATVNLLDYSVYCSLDSQCKTPLSETNASLHGADGNPLELKGETEIKINTGEETYSVGMVVARLGSLQGILGMKFLQEETTNIDTVSGRLTYGGMQHQLHHVRVAGCCRVRLTEGVTLTSGEETLVHGCFDGEELTDGPVLLEQNSNDLVAQGIMLPRAIVEAGEPTVAFTIANVGKTLRLLPGTPIAMVEPVEDVTDPLCQRGGHHSQGEGSKEEPETQRSLPITASLPCEGKSGETPGEAEVDIVPLPEHLQPLFDQAVGGLNEAQAREVRALLLEEQDMFVGPEVGLGRTHLVKHGIDTGDARPVKMAPRRQGPYIRGAIDEEVRKMLDQGIVRPSCSPWSSPVVLARKKDGSLRFCVDYRNLNQLTRMDAYPLPCINSCIDSLSGSRWFNTLDLASGYWQVEMEESSRPKTAFVTHQGLFEFNVMSFGLTNAPATFERLMERTLRGLQWQECLIFLDDIIVFGSSFNEAKDRLQHVLARFREAGLRLKPSSALCSGRRWPS